MNKPVILFESYPDFNGSALAVYEELVKRGYDQKYDLIWAVYSDFNLKTNYKVVKFFNCNSPEKQDVIKRTVCIIDSNRYIQKFNSNVYRFHVRHGFSIKASSIGYNKNLGLVDGILATSEELLKIELPWFPENARKKFIITGMPATDGIFHPKNLYNGFIQELTETDIKFNKIITWLPTFRDHRFSHFGKNRFKFGLPALHSVEEYNKLNDTLKKNNNLLIIQMHHAQAKNYTQLPIVSNIKIVNEAIKLKYGLSTIDLLGNSDALLTDYSAAYHEYVILNRPIGLCIEDLPQYAKNNGFPPNYNYLDWIKGDYLLDVNDICLWLNDITNGIDKHKTEREQSLNRIHKYKDDKATERVVNHILEQSKI